MNKINYLFITILFLFIFSFTNELLPQEKMNNTIGLNVFNTFSFWETGNLHYDNLGFGTFFSPFYKYKSNNVYFQSELVLSSFDFTGPDELTETGPDDDVDLKFDSELQRSDIGFQIGYSIFNSINLSFSTKYFYMFIKGDHKFNEGSQRPFNYTEKGFLFGPGIVINLPNNNSKSFFQFSMFYLIDHLNYSYLSHRRDEREPYKNKIDIQLLTADIGYNSPIVKDFQLGISLKTEYSFKTRYAYSNKYNADLWFIGFNAGISYIF